MITNETASFRSRVHPPKFDHELALAEFGDRVFSTDLLDDPAFEALVESSLRRSVGYKVVGMDKLDPARRGKMVISEANAGNPRAVYLLEMGRRILQEKLPRYLQLMFCGEKTYIFSEETEKGFLLEDAASGFGEPPADAFQIVFRDPSICRLAVNAYTKTMERDTLEKAPLLGASTYISLTRHRRDDGSIYREIQFDVFIPHGGNVSSRGFYMRISDENFRLLMEGGNTPSLLNDLIVDSFDTLEGKDVRRLNALMLATVRACRMATDPEVQLCAPLNPAEVLKSRAENAALPKKQRDRSKETLRNAPDAPLTFVVAPGEQAPTSNQVIESVSLLPELPKWSATKNYFEETVISEDPRARNLHGQLHPQAVMSQFPGLGRRGWHFLKNVDKAEAKIADHSERNGSEEPPVGSSGVSMDQVALDLSEETIADFDGLFTIYNASLLDLPVEHRPQDIRGFFAIANLHEELHRYRLSGSQCFMISGEVSQMMAVTDIADIDMSDIMLPYDALYMAFEKPATMEVDGKQCRFEGAYLHGTAREIAVMMIFSPENGNQEITPSAFRAPLKINLPRTNGMSLGDAVIEAIQNGGYDLDKGDAIFDPKDEAELAKLHDFEVFVPEKTSQELIVEANEGNFTTMLDALNIVANSMMAMTAGPEEIHVQETWGDLGSEAKRLLQSGSEKSRRKGRAIAQAENAMPVRIIKLGTEARARLHDEIQKVRKSPEEAYWRRGHWRRQAYGAGRSLRKWVWVEPQLCNADAALRRSGSVYVAKVDRDPSPSF